MGSVVRLVTLALFALLLASTAFGQAPPCSVSVVPASGLSPLNVQANASCAVGTGFFLTSIDWGDGTVDTFAANQTSGTVNHTYHHNPAFANSPQTFFAVLNYTNANAQAGQTGQTVSVNNPVNCALTVTPNSGLEPFQVTATGNCTSQNSTIQTVTIDWGDNTPVANTSTAMHTYTQLATGAHTVSITATDANGETSSAFQSVSVTSPVSCTFNVNPSSGDAPFLVNAVGNCTSQNSTITSESIDWGDQTPTSAGGTASHIYTSPGQFGQYVASITGIDANGNPGSQSLTIFVGAAGAPVCTLSITPANGKAPLSVTANVNCSTTNFVSASLGFGDGSPGVTSTQPSFSVSYTYDGAGTFQAFVSGSYASANALAEQNVTVTSAGSGPQPALGDVYVSGPTGVVERHNPSGALVQILDTQSGNRLGDMVFDLSHNLYVTFSNSPNIFKFDQNGNAQPFGNGRIFGAVPIVSDKSGNFYIGGSAGEGPTEIQMLDSSGNVLQTFTPNPNQNNGRTVRGMDLAADQCTMYYTVSTQVISRFDVCTGADLPDFTDANHLLPAANSGAFDARILNNGQILVADYQQIFLLDAGGNVVQTYGSQKSYEGLSLDPDGTTFWATQQTGEVDHIALASGNVLSQFNVNFQQAQGVTILGEIRAATNTGPSCTLGVSPSSGALPLNVTATGNCTDATSTVASSTIDFGDGTVLNGPVASHTYATTGTFTVKLTATDTNGLSTTATQTVTVTANQPPVCTLSVVPASGPAPLNVTATGNCTDPENDITSTSLDFGDGTVVSGATSGTHTYAKAGSYTVKVTATDVANNIGSATQLVSVGVNQPPVCTLSVAPTSGIAPLNVTATGNCTDPENDITGTTLDFGDGTIQAGTSGTHIYAQPGIYAVKVTATDVANNTASATQSVIVGANTAPVCTLTVTPNSGQAPLTITAIGSCSGTNTINALVLDFGDGTTANAVRGTHTYSQAGTYTVKITATDVFGLSGSATQTVTVAFSNFPSGIFIGVSGGKILQFAADGTVLKTINTGVAGTVAGMAFDKAGNLYTVDFTAGNITEVNPNSGTVIGSFGSGYNCQPESMVFDGAGNVYVGQQGCSLALLKFDPTGKPLATFQVATEEQGSDDLALSADECTMLYTSEGPSVLRYDVCHNQQLPPFATGLKKALTLRILPDGGAIVADLVDIVRLNSTGQTTMTYTLPGAQCLYGVALDQDGKTFWADDYCSSNIFHVDLASGKVLSQFNTGTPSGTVFGLAISGSGLNVAGVGNGGTLTASPQSATLASGQSATFTVSFTPNAAAAGLTVQLSCAGLPAGLICSFNPATLTLGAAGTTSTSTLTISRTATAALMHPASPWMLATWTGMVPAIVLAGLRGSRRRRGSLLWLGIVVASAGIWASCGGGTSMSQSNTPTVTPQGAYTVIVVGNANGVQASTTVNITVP